MINSSEANRRDAARRVALPHGPNVTVGAAVANDAAADAATDHHHAPPTVARRRCSRT